MCGIAGILGSASPSELTRMLDAQRHRGPDGRSIWIAPEGVALGHDRLAIIDLAGGVQPIPNEDASLHATVNGEIYNCRRLRAELEHRHAFRTHSDSEVVLHLFEEEGPGCVSRLDGMFAVAIWGSETGLFLARDPLGIKPLYYGYDRTGSLRWSSEIEPLLDAVPAIRELPAGSYMVEGQAPVRYWAVPRPSAEIHDADQAIRLLEETLLTAIHKRLMADVPLGVFLSGGLDSSLIAAMMRRMVDGELHSFCVGLEGSEDVKNARMVAQYLGTVHHERVLKPGEVIATLPLVVDALESCDPALVRSAIPTYFVSEMASRYVKVVLSGEGADELYAGYHYLTEFEPDAAALSDELWQITDALHSSNLQRVDRMTMVHGLEGRVPFLDREMIALAFRTDPALKQRDGHGKWLLRKVAAPYLPDSIVWRKKEKFAIGTGIGPLLQRYAEEMVPDSALPPGVMKEEWLYWQYFREKYGRSDVVGSMGMSRSLNPAQRFVSRIADLV